MVTIRAYEAGDAQEVGRLIADTYRTFNLSFVPAEGLAAYLGPFQHARSVEPAHQQAIASAIQASMVLVAEKAGEIVGVLRGREDKLQSLFVKGEHHRRGVGRLLVHRFEQECVRSGSPVIRVMSTVYAVPFYKALGYRKTTGIRSMRSFDGQGLPYQPMKKTLRHDSSCGEMMRSSVTRG